MIEYGQDYTCAHGEPPGDCRACDPYDIDPDREPHTDLGNAKRLVAAYGKHLRYVAPWKKWLCWDGRRWARDVTLEHARCAKEVARSITEQVREMQDSDLKKALQNAARRAESAPGIRGMLELASSELGVVIDPIELDADPDVLNTQTGVLDLRTGVLWPHQESRNLTKLTGAGYDPNAEAPRFMAFLERIQPDAVMRRFLQRLFGQSLSGRVTEHILPILHGVGANGKSRFTEAVRRVMGDYAAPVDPGLLIDRGEAHPTGTADLFGLRLALTTETDKGRRLAEGTLKRLTGGEEITARRMREDFWSFSPTHQIVMVTNHPPIVTGTDEGIWRRLRIVPFDVVIPVAERTPQDVLDGALWDERDGILRWMVEGYHEYLRTGLDEPASVVESTEKYRSDTDMLALFLKERCVVGPHFHVPARAMFEAWRAWCEPINIPPGSEVTFARAMNDKGYDNSGRNSRGKFWAGVGLQDDE